MATSGPALLLLGAWTLYGELGAGGGVDSSLNRSADVDDAVVAGHGALSALAGSALPLAKERPDELFVELGWDWMVLPEYSDLTSHRVALGAGVAWELVSRLTLRISGSAAALVYGNTERDGFSAGGGTDLRWRARDWLVPAVRVDFTLRTARDDAFGYQALRGSAYVAFLPGERVDLTLGYALSATDVVTYEAVPAQDAAPSPRGHGRRAAVSTFGSEQLAVQRPALVHALDASASVDLTDALYATASFGLELVRADGSTAVAHIAALRVAVHWE